jgi:hypothetical protein
MIAYKRFLEERGQVLLLSAILMIPLLGFGALVVDVGSLYRASRQLQSDVDAAALAGAQDLPDANSAGSVPIAQATATAFFRKNAADNPDPQRSLADPAFPAPSGAGCTSTDCLSVTDTSPNGGILAAVLGFLGPRNVSVHAQAYVGPPAALGDVIPAAISQTQFQCLLDGSASGFCTQSACDGSFPCDDAFASFDDPANGLTLLDLTSGTTTMPDTSTSCNNVATATMVSWMNTGFPNELYADQWYCDDADAGQHNGIRSGFRTDGSISFIPIYSSGTPTANAHALYVVGFAAFVIASVSWNGNTHVLRGNFVQALANGVSSGNPGPGPFGVTVVGLDG